jgi:hypothetical protein
VGGNVCSTRIFSLQAWYGLSIFFPYMMPQRSPYLLTHRAFPILFIPHHRTLPSAKPISRRSATWFVGLDTTATVQNHGDSRGWWQRGNAHDASTCSTFGSSRIPVVDQRSTACLLAVPVRAIGPIQGEYPFFSSCCSLYNKCPANGQKTHIAQIYFLRKPFFLDRSLAEYSLG